jgi:drug/metabolite transporter (DMT)-like permease
MLNFTAGSGYLWVVFSMMTALVVATQDAWVKKFFSHLSSLEMAAFPLIYSLPLFCLGLCFVSVPSLNPDFLWSYLLSLPINAVGFLLYMKAIRQSPLSLTLPYLAFTPVFMIATGLIFLNEIPNVYGIAGISSICIGSYVLNLEPDRFSFLSPFKAIFKETGSWIMLIVALVFSFGAVIGKVAIINSSPVFFAMFFFSTFDLFLIVILWATGKIQMATFVQSPAKGLFTGSLLFCHALFHAWAISMTKAAYMIPVKRLSILFGIIYGGLIFKEKNLLIRFTGAFLMMSGAVLIMMKGG